MLDLSVLAFNKEDFVNKAVLKSLWQACMNA